MSRLLGVLNMSRKKFAVGVVCLATLLLCVYSPAMLVVWAIAVLMMWINLCAFRINRKQAAPFDAKSDVRNVDMLIIGDMVNPEAVQAKRYVQICAPGRGLRACYEILRHTHSILDDESGKSCVVIAVKKSCMNRESFSVFDMPFFHTITVKKYGLDKLRRLQKLPIIAEPLESLRLLLGVKSRNYHEDYNLPQEISAFCDERGYRLRLFLS